MNDDVSIDEKRHFFTEKRKEKKDKYGRPSREHRKQTNS